MMRFKKPHKYPLIPSVEWPGPTFKKPAPGYKYG